MYNLFVTAEAGRWNKSHVTYEMDRVFEHTSRSLVERYKIFNNPAKEGLKSIPSLFVYESQRQMDSRIGWINNINATRNFVEVEFEIDSSYPSIPDSNLTKLLSKLDIDNWEMNRTHWAIKNIDLFNTLFEAELIQERKPRELHVFICYCSEDIEKAEKLYSYLSKHGIKAWLDKRDILAGQDWEAEIRTAIKESHAIVICLSAKSITKEGFVQKEIRTAMEIADEKPEGTIFIIPTRLEDCKVPESLAKFQWVDLFLENGPENLIRALQNRAKSLDIRIRKTTT